MIFAIGFGVPLGFFAAKRHGGAFDHGSLFLADRRLDTGLSWRSCSSTSWRLGWLPSVGRISVTSEVEHPTNFYILDAIITRDWATLKDAIEHLILPAIALGSIPLAIITRITRASVLDVQNEDYVRMHARRAASAHRRRGRARPAQRAAADHDDHRLQTRPAPIGRDLTETIFAWPGVGSWLRDAIFNQDYAVLPGRDPVPGLRLRVRQPDRGHLVRVHQPADPLQLMRRRLRCRFQAVRALPVRPSAMTRSTRSSEGSRMSVAEIEAVEVQLDAPSGLWRDAFHRLLRDPGAIAGFTFVFVFVLCAIFAPWIATHDQSSRTCCRSRTAAVPAPRRAPGSASTCSGGISSRGSMYGARVSL